MNQPFNFVADVKSCRGASCAAAPLWFKVPSETVSSLLSPCISSDYLSNTSLWSECLEPAGVVSWHLSLFSVLLVMGLIQIALCAVQVVNGLLGALCGDCCGCCGSVSVI